MHRNIVDMYTGRVEGGACRAPSWGVRRGYAAWRPHPDPRGGRRQPPLRGGGGPLRGLPRRCVAGPPPLRGGVGGRFIHPVFCRGRGETVSEKGEGLESNAHTTAACHVNGYWLWAFLLRKYTIQTLSLNHTTPPGKACTRPACRSHVSHLMAGIFTRKPHPMNMP